MTDITVEEMLRALEAMYFVWFSSGPKYLPMEGRHKEVYLAIRAALEPVTEEERKELEKHFNYIQPINIDHLFDCDKCNKIRALILGNQGGGVTEKK